MLKFSPHEMKYIWYFAKKKENLLFNYLILKGKLQRAIPIIFHGFDLLSVFIRYNIGCQHCLHLENGVELHSNE